jgi:hypothetical protein
VKNLITLLALATFSLTACKKEATTTPAEMLYVYGHAVDSVGTPKANMHFDVLLGRNLFESGASFNATPIDSFVTDSLGSFHFTMYKPLHNQQVTILYNWSTVSSTFTITLPVGDSLNVNNLSVIDLRYN